MSYRAGPLWLIPSAMMVGLDTWVFSQLGLERRSEFVEGWPLSLLRAAAWLALMLFLICDRTAMDWKKASLCFLCIALYLLGPLMWVSKALDF